MGKISNLIGLAINWILSKSLAPLLFLSAALDFYLLYDALVNRGFFACLMMLIVGLPIITGIQIVLGGVAFVLLSGFAQYLIGPINSSDCAEATRTEGPLQQVEEPTERES
jgi:hypothetical protein